MSVPYLEVKFDTNAMIRQLDEYVAVLNKRDDIGKACLEVAETLRGYTADSLLAHSPQGGRDILAGISKSHRNFRTKHTGIAAEISKYSPFMAIVSIGQGDADYRLHFLEGGTQDRYTGRIYHDRPSRGGKAYQWGRYQGKLKKDYSLNQGKQFRGKVEGMWFFQEAIDKNESALNSQLESKLRDVISSYEQTVSD